MLGRKTILAGGSIEVISIGAFAFADNVIDINSHIRAKEAASKFLKHAALERVFST